MSRLFSHQLHFDLLTTSSAPVTLPSEYRDLAKSLSEIHGTVKVSNESSGIHFYIACPECLDDYGESELDKLHLAINVEKYFAGRDRCASCMKHGGAYNVTDLVSMPPLSARGIKHRPEVIHLNAIPAHYLESDGKGNFIPKSPGAFIPVNILPPDHPARIYLTHRNFDPDVLWEQFRCSYCYKENDDLFYRRLRGGFKVTPQGRLIFFAYVGGVRVGWQARILEIDDGNYKFYWHPYKADWVAVMSRADDKSPWELMPGYDEWDPAKYFTGHGTRRNSILLGFDAAVSFNELRKPRHRFCFLVEGAMDAARLGPPAVAMMGKSLSEAQARLIESRFSLVILVPDNDAAGSASRQSVAKHLGGKVTIVPAELPKSVKDAGDLDPGMAEIFRRTTLQRIFEGPST